MDDLIPLIIVIAISIIGVIGRSKKKRRQGENITPNPVSKNNDDLFDWFEKITDDKEDQDIPYTTDNAVAQNTEKLQTIDNAIEEQSPNQYSKHSGFITHEEKKEIVAKEGSSFVKDKKNEEKDLSIKTIKENEIGVDFNEPEFDLQKAVIYSEILNPKYI